jgi:capsular exopolysaccharide synthesis family protein
MNYPEHRIEVLQIAPPAQGKVALQLANAVPGTLNPVEPGVSLAHFTKIIRRYKWTLVVFMATAMVIAVVIQLTVPKLYQATALVKVDRHAAGGIIGQEASQVSSVDDMDQIITTQMELAVSDPVLHPIVEKYNLLEVEKQFRGLSPEEMKRKRAAPIKLKRLDITRPPNTYLIRITYRAHDPQLAANIANDIASSIANHANDTENHSYAEISDLISRDMSQLHSKMETSARSLAAFEKELNMVDPQQRTTILTARLAQLNTEYTTAQTERLHREAVLKGADTSKTLASAQAAESAAQGNLLNDSVQRLNAMRQQFATVRSFYGENHPEYRKAKQQLNEVEAQVAQLMINAADRARVDYDQAVNREGSLRHLVEQAKEDVDDLSFRSLQYEQLKSEAENDKKLYQDLENRTREADINRQFQNATVQLAASALPPDEQIFPKLIIDLPLAFVLSGLLGVFGVVLVNALDTTFSDPEEVANELRIDVLATIPNAKRLPQASSLEATLANNTNGSRRVAEAAGRYVEAIRTLRTVVSLAAMDRPVRTVLITSANAGEGKSSTAAHLAIACAQVGKRVLLIDADLRRPTLHKQFGVECLTGLSDVLTNDANIRDATVKVKETELYLMPAGPVSRRASDIISVGFSDVLKKVSADFDLVIVDSPPMLGISDAQELAAMVDSVIVVTKAGVTSGRAVSDTLARLNRVGANVMGLVMNQVKFSDVYGYDYKYYYSAADDSRDVHRERVGA